MVVAQGYRIEKKIQAGAGGEVCAAVRQSDGLGVVLKSFAAGTVEDRRAAAERELQALRVASGKGVPTVVELIGNEQPVLVLERAPGSSLSAYASEAALTPETFLRVAIQLAEILSRVHAARLIHRDVHPSNILVDPATLETHLLDFGLARPLGSMLQPGEQKTSGDRRLVGALQYVSPEQTGRMDRGVDSRSDLYSLGASLHYALTGRPPFEGDDALTLVHAHLAIAPTATIELRPDLPATLSRIVSKLLQKSPEERYQTAHALQRDLCECEEQLRTRGEIADDFPLATADVPYRPLFPRRVFGRDAEVAVLREAYVRATSGEPTLVLLAGAPGVGKTALVHELRSSLVESRGYLAEGKFDLYRRDVPYSGFCQALDSVTQQILTESNSELASWRAAFDGTVGGIGGALVELVPDLGIVLGESLALPPLGPAQTRARLSLALQRFVRTVATANHPLVLFLDDVHWADASSQDLLRDLLLQLRSCALLVICSYRDTEVDSAHPLQQLTAELTARGKDVDRIVLRPLSADASAQMLAAALGRTEEVTRPLADRIARRIGSAPLLVQQFVQHMYDLGLIRFEPGVGWDWDDASLAAASIPDDAVEVVAAKIQRLGESERKVLELASCIADQVDVSALVELSDLDSNEILASLYHLADEGLLAPSHAGFRFAHDRIREAAQSHWPASERNDFHDRAGRRLLERIPEEQIDERLFEILDHLNRASERIAGEGERVQRIELNLRAGRRALRAGAPTAAERYLAAGRALFDPEDWERDPATSFHLHAQSAECAYAASRHDDALAWLDVLEVRPNLSEIERASIVARRTSIYAVARSPQEAVGIALQGLARLGLRWSAEPSRVVLWLETLRSACLLATLREDSLGPINSRNPQWLPRLLILFELIGPAFRTSWSLQSRIGYVALWSSLRWGSPAPAFTISGAAMTVAQRTGNYTRGSRHAHLVLRMLERDPTQSGVYRARMSVFAFIKSFVLPRREIMPELAKCREAALEQGDVSFALYSEQLRLVMMWIVGDPLDRCEELRREYMEFSENLGGADAAIGGLMLAVFAALRGSGPARRPAVAYEGYDPSILVPARSAWIACYVMLGDAQSAFEESESLLADIDRVYCNLPHVQEFWLFRGLSAATLATAAPHRAARGYRRALSRSCRLMKNWARHGPANFEPASLLLDAERARLDGKYKRALSLYDRAAQSARLYSYPHHEALAHARWAEFLLRTLHRETEAASRFRRAAELYECWGASFAAVRLRAQCE